MILKIFCYSGDSRETSKVSKNTLVRRKTLFPHHIRRTPLGYIMRWARFCLIYVHPPWCESLWWRQDALEHPVILSILTPTAHHARLARREKTTTSRTAIVHHPKVMPSARPHRHSMYRKSPPRRKIHTKNDTFTRQCSFRWKLSNICIMCACVT